MAFKRLSHAQYATGWVLCCIGRACFEMVNYAQAAVNYEWARQVDPHRLEVCLPIPQPGIGYIPAPAKELAASCRDPGWSEALAGGSSCC